MGNGGPISDMFNSWDANLNLTVTNADFQSVAFAPPASCPAPYAPGGTPCVLPTDMTTFGGMASARQADGSLPFLPFLRLAATSKLIDKGTNVGLPYAGSAPDLGCFETGLAFDPSDGGSGSSSDGSTSSSTGSGDGGVASDAGVTGSSTGDASGGASSTSSSSGSNASSGASGNSSGGASGGSPVSGETGAQTGDKSGCGCESVGVRGPLSQGALASIGLVLAGLGLVRRRRVPKV